MREDTPLWVVVHQMRRAGFNPVTIGDVLGLDPRAIQAINLELQRLLRVEGLSDDQTPTPCLDRCRRRLRESAVSRVAAPALHLPGGAVYEAVKGSHVADHGRAGV